MDTLHGVMRTLAPARKSETGTKDHVTVFRDFISHLDKIARQPARPPRAKATRIAKRKTRK